MMVTLNLESAVWRGIWPSLCDPSRQTEMWESVEREPQRQ